MIAGHTYRMACNDGEEAHLQGLARGLDEKIERLKESFGEIGDQRITIMAAITVADELSEAQNKIASLEAEIARLQAEASNSSNGREVLADQIAESLGEAASRLERVAQDLNQTTQR
jgi:cell division protein ZapA